MTTEEIYQSLVNEKDNYPELAELDSSSKVAIWRLWVWIFAFASKAMYEIFESFKAYTEVTFAKNQQGTLLWWNTEIRAWQFGDTLQFLDGVFKYAVIDELKQLVSQVSLETLDAVLVFKVAKDDGAGGLEPLTLTERDTLQGYINQIKFPGTFTTVISIVADDLKLNYKIYYNAELVQADIELAIANSVDLYLASVVFNGKFQHTELTDQLQLIEGVEFPIFENGFAKPDASPTIDYVEIVDNYTASAGYFKIDELNLTMIPNV